MQTMSRWGEHWQVDARFSSIRTDSVPFAHIPLRFDICLPVFPVVESNQCNHRHVVYPLPICRRSDEPGMARLSLLRRVLPTIPSPGNPEAAPENRHFSLSVRPARFTDLPGIGRIERIYPLLQPQLSLNGYNAPSFGGRWRMPRGAGTTGCSGGRVESMT